jgi:hypothetical protein
MSPGIGTTRFSRIYDFRGPRTSTPNPIYQVRRFHFCYEESTMLNTVLTEYITSALPSQIDVEFHIRITR